jgi:2-polyprenyl-3-methyl-5-hydroxy-6-metoxy-1,4-benzoquinol methylase
VEAAACPGVELLRWDVEETPWPLGGETFSAVTLLAVLEHLAPERVRAVLGECHRLLVPGGVVVLTFPAAWTAGLLRAMAGVGLLSRTEIDDHKGSLSRHEVGRVLVEAGFPAECVETGVFELGANTWVRARRGAGESA